MGLSDRLNASNAEFKKMLDMPLPQKIEHIKLECIAEDLTIEREKPKRSPISDPFQITVEQQEMAAKRSLALHLEGKSLDEAHILYAITAATVSEYWASRGNASEHWDNISARAISQLQQLGFRDNADIQRYLDHGEIPNVSD